MPTTQTEGKLPPPSGSPPGFHAYPSLRPSMGRGTRPPRSKAEVILRSWNAPGSQRPPKAMRKRLAGVEGRTSSTSWLRTRNSAWYGSRGPGRARLAPQDAPSPTWILPKPPLTQAPPYIPSDSFLPPDTPYITGPKYPSLTLTDDCQPNSQERSCRGFPGCPASHCSSSLPFHTHPSRWGRASGTFWVPNQQHQPLPGGVEAVPVVRCDLERTGKRAQT